MSVEDIRKVHPTESVHSKFIVFTEREHARALRRTKSKVKDYFIAEDIVQIALFRLWKKYQDKPSDELGRLFNRILHNVTMDHFHQKGRDPHLYGIEKDSPVYDIPAPDGDASDQLENIQLRSALIAGAGILSTRQREIWNMRHVREMSIEEIAVELDLSEGSVKTHLSRAKEKLAQLFNGYRETGHFSKQLQRILGRSVETIIQHTDKPLLGKPPNISITNRLQMDQILLRAIEGGSINLESWEAYQLSAKEYTVSSREGAIIPTTKNGVAKILGMSQNGLYPEDIVRHISKDL